MTSEDPILEVKRLSVRFGGVQALTDIGFSVQAGQNFGVIGPNGAGKTTLFNAISGFIKPGSGASVRFDRQHELVGKQVDAIARLGIARTFQNILLVKSLSVRDNILAGMHLSLGYSPVAALLPWPAVRSAERRALARVEEVAHILGFAPGLLDVRADVLPLGLQKKVEVARAVARRPRLLMIDEPAGGLNDMETHDLADSLRRLRSAEDVTIVLIDHDMSFVMKFCDQICVLNFGNLVAQGTPAHIMTDQDVIDCYLGVSDDA